MRWVAFSIALLISPALGQVTVTADQPIEGATLEFARITPDGSYCRAPFGTETYFKLDSAGRLWLIQSDLQRAASLSTAEIIAYRDARGRALARVDEASKALMASPEVDHSFKTLLATYGQVPALTIGPRLLRIPSRPSASARRQPQLAALEAAIAVARREIANAGLTNTILGDVATCLVDVSALPTSVKPPKAGARLLDQKPSDAATVNEAAAYRIVPLYDLLSNFGLPIASEPPK